MEEENKIVTEDLEQQSFETSNSGFIPEQKTEGPHHDKSSQSGALLSAPQVEKPKKNFLKFFTSISGIVTIAVIVVCVILAVLFINKRNNEKHYEENLKDFMVEAGKSSIASAYICEDLQTVWHDYIFEDKEYFDRSTGTFTDRWGHGDTYCSNFSEAVNKKIAWNENHLPTALTEPYYKAKSLYKEMTPPPGKYKDIHVYVKQIFKAMERIHDLSQNPTGNLSTYSSNCNQALDEYSSALSDLTNECDIDFSKVGEDDDD